MGDYRVDNFLVARARHADAGVFAQLRHLGFGINGRSLRGRQVEQGFKARQIHRAAELNQGIQCRARRGLFECCEIGFACLAAAALLSDKGVQHHAAADGARGGLIAQNKTVAVQRAYGFVELQLHDGRLARRDVFTTAYGDARGDIRRGQMQMHRRPVFERLCFARQHAHAPGNALCRVMNRGCEHPVATTHGFKIGAGEIQRAALSRHRLLRGLALNLNAAHAHFVAGRRNHQLVAGHNSSVKYGARHHGTAACHTERTVSGIAKMLIGAGA